MDAILSRYSHDALPLPRLTGGLASRLAARFDAGIRAVQHARMLQALSELTDDQLDTIGLSRADIPAHARACVYGPAT